MTATLDIMMTYFIRIVPGMLLAIGCLALLPRKHYLGRAIVYVLMFVLIRDAMTPLGFWRFGGDPAFWIRFSDNSVLLWLLSGGSLGMVMALLAVEPEMRRLLSWHKGSRMWSIFTGVAAVPVITGPWLIHYFSIPLSGRGGAVPTGSLLPILGMTVTGNLLEEVLFRGYFQGALRRSGMGEVRSAALSGLFFGCCHMFLACTVTNVGWPLLLFATWEGLIVAFLRNRRGLSSAVIAHGLSVAVLASGLF